MQPALFLHFVLTFPEKRQMVRKHPWLLALVYVPGAILLAAHVIAMRWLQASERLRWNLDRMEMSYGSLFFLAAAAVLWYSYRHASTTILRQQLKWVTRGTILAIIPYTLFYVVPYLMGSLPGRGHEGLGAVAGVAASYVRLCHLPLSADGCGSDLQARRGLHAGGGGDRVGMYFGLVAGVAELVHMRQPSSGPMGLILAVVVTALLFDPVRKWIQDRVDQFFYRTRYDYRRTLLEFGRELSSETDLNAMLSR